MSNKSTLELYDQNAKDYAASYRRLNSQDVLPYFFSRLADIKNPHNLTALDIGCGSGRDARAMADLGYQVLGVDGAPQMLAEAKESNLHNHIEYLCDTGPDFPELMRRKQRFDIILISAFIFHLDRAERQHFYQNLALLAAESCYIHLLLRYGPSRDARIMYDVPLSEMETCAKIHGFDMTKYDVKADMLGRDQVSWQALDLTRGGLFN